MLFFSEKEDVNEIIGKIREKEQIVFAIENVYADAGSRK